MSLSLPASFNAGFLAGARVNYDGINTTKTVLDQRVDSQPKKPRRQYTPLWNVTGRPIVGAPKTKLWHPAITAQ
jgi:hypothetical protein